jgi:hypothetical protein
MPLPLPVPVVLDAALLTVLLASHLPQAIVGDSPRAQACAPHRAACARAAAGDNRSTAAARRLLPPPAAMATEYLEKYIESVADLPAQLQRKFRLIRDLDEKSARLQVCLPQRAGAWRAWGAWAARSARMLLRA